MSVFLPSGAQAGGRTSNLERVDAGETSRVREAEGVFRNDPWRRESVGILGQLMACISPKPRCVLIPSKPRTRTRGQTSIDRSKTAGSAFISREHGDSSAGGGNARKTRQRQCCVWSLLKLTSQIWRAADVLPLSLKREFRPLYAAVALSPSDFERRKTPKCSLSPHICFLL